MVGEHFLNNQGSQKNEKSVEKKGGGVYTDARSSRRLRP
jgi:hypothetical protein